MAGTVVADTLQAASTSTLVLKNGVANTPPTVQDSAGTQIGTFCRAWVNFNGTGTVAIRASFNVSSITDNGTGNYTVTIATNMTDANYATPTSCAIATTGTATSQNGDIYVNDLVAGSYRIATSNNGTLTDMAIVTSAIFR